MSELSDFRLGADVVASDGRKVGKIASVIVEEDGFDLRALVVKEEESFAGRLLAAESFFITDEVVIPIAAVESATPDLVRLNVWIRCAPSAALPELPLQVTRCEDGSP